MNYLKSVSYSIILLIGSASQFKMQKLYHFVLLLLLTTTLSIRSPLQDMVTRPPGFGPDFSTDIYAGYLKTTNNSYTHYIFVESAKGRSNNDPITLWMNGQPGCTSKIGFLKQIGPYLISEGTPYRIGDLLTNNPYSWHKLSNLLFIDGPVGVGYSMNQNSSYSYNDQNTAEFNFNALIDFFNKYPEYRYNPFYLAGEFYAGKMIPDLALRINTYNQKATSKINLKAILIGNGIMDLSDDNLQKSQINYIYSHNFVDPTLDKYWQIACQADPTSAGCTFFLRRYDDLLSTVNYHNIYGACYRPQNNKNPSNNPQQNNGMSYNNQYKKCQYYKAVQQYFQLHWVSYHSIPQNTSFVACNQTIFNKYDMNELGSMNQYKRLVKQTSIRIHLYSGDWDDVVPFTNTIRNLDKLGFRQNGGIVHWVNTNNRQHIGFKRNFMKDNVLIKLWIVKGAGHEVPQHKPEVAYQLFKDFLSNAG